MTRRAFIESHGATCKNWQWSWSFINQAKRMIIFGAWDRDTVGEKTKILSDEWGGPGYSQSREHVRLIEEEGYQLWTFPMRWKDGKNGGAKIGGFTDTLIQKKLKRKPIRTGFEWWALPDHSVPLLPPEELSAPKEYPEGAKSRVTINAYERNPKARAACITHHGYVCAVCGFDFSRAYGSLGAGYIQVHHIVPIGQIGKEYKVDPIRDLIPVCPNCHAMLHRGAGPPLTVEQLRHHLRK